MREIKEFKDLQGHVLSKIENKSGDELVFTLETGERYKLFHEPDCCEDVRIEEIIGNPDNLIGYPILLAEEISYEGENPTGVIVPESQDSFTWTFYKLVTMWGSVTIRWYGESNGYYSEAVSFERIR